MSAGAATRYLVIGTGGTGGVFYPYGGGLAQLLSKKLADTQATAEVTGGSVDNVKLLGAGDPEIGFSTMDSAFDGFKGEAAYKDVGPQPIATLAVLYPSVLHVVASKVERHQVDRRYQGQARLGRFRRLVDRIDRRPRDGRRRARSRWRMSRATISASRNRSMR